MHQTSKIHNGLFLHLQYFKTFELIKHLSLKNLFNVVFLLPVFDICGYFDRKMGLQNCRQGMERVRHTRLLGVPNERNFIIGVFLTPVFYICESFRQAQSCKLQLARFSASLRIQRRVECGKQMFLFSQQVLRNKNYL